MDNYACACVVLPLNGFDSSSFILIYGQFPLANGACIVSLLVSFTQVLKKKPLMVYYAKLLSLPAFAKP